MFSAQFHDNVALCQQWNAFTACIKENWHTLTHVKISDRFLQGASHAIETRPGQEPSHTVRDMARHLADLHDEKIHRCVSVAFKSKISELERIRQNVTFF